MTFSSSANKKRCYTSIAQKRELFNSSLKYSQPTFNNARFQNPWFTFKRFGFTDLIAWKAKYVPEDERIYNENLRKSMQDSNFTIKKELSEYLDVDSVFDKNRLREPVPKGSVRVTWLGHA